MGSLLVQLAARSGATVVGAVGSGRKVEAVEALGVDLAVDYSSRSWTERVRDEVGVIDVVFDSVGGAVGHDAFGLLADGGRFVPFGMASGAFTEIPDDEVGRRGLTVERFTPRGPEELRALHTSRARCRSERVAPPARRPDVSVGARRRSTCRDRRTHHRRQDAPRRRRLTEPEVDRRRAREFTMVDLARASYELVSPRLVAR